MLVYPASSSLVRARISVGAIATEDDDSSAASWGRGRSDAATVRSAKPQNKTPAHKLAITSNGEGAMLLMFIRILCGVGRVSF